MLNKLIKGIKNPRRALIYILGFKIFRLIPDSICLRIKYRLKMGKKLDLINPKTFNEKLQWLKLYDRKPEYTNMVDKYEARKYIAEKIGEEYLIPLLGVWGKVEDIDFEQLPNQFVLKPNHTSGNVYICKDKSKINYEELKKEIDSWMKREYYWVHREWPYKNVKPRIICEKYMVDESGYELKDYKIFCFNGKPEYVEVDFNRQVEHKLNPYDFDWNPLNFCDESKNDYNANIKKPERLEEMRNIAGKLSEQMDFLRVDFYSINNEIYVGELTLYPGSGYIKFDPPETDLKYGESLKLTKMQTKN